MTVTRRSILHALVLCLVLGGWALVLRPQSLGGPVVYVIVRGSSMVPTYQTGDLVIVAAAATYQRGDVVAYRVPAGEIGEGHLVIHRIAGGDASSGFVVKGDNNDAPDPWLPRNANIAGSARLALPGIGRAFAFMSQPINAGALAAAIVVAIILARPRRQPLHWRHEAHRSI